MSVTFHERYIIFLAAAIFTSDSSDIPALIVAGFTCSLDHNYYFFICHTYPREAPRDVAVMLQGLVMLFTACLSSIDPVSWIRCGNFSLQASTLHVLC